MKNLLLVWITFQLSSLPIHAQENEHASISALERKSFHNHNQAKTTVADPGEDDYDVKYVKLDLSLNNQNTQVSGNATTMARVTAASMQNYIFELSNELTIDSLFIDGQPLVATGSGTVRTVALTTPLLQNDVFTVQVFYHGEPLGGSGFFTVGINNTTSPSWGNQVTYTLSEPYHASDWWPAKQSLTDKIDSADTWLTVDASLKAGSNGLLKAVTPVVNNQSRYEWHTAYPIDYYLLSATVSSYVDYSFYVALPNSNDSVLVQNYVYDNPQTLPHFKSRIDSVGLMIRYFSRLYGKYPFWQEKYGHCMAPIGGGMEHQTMTTLGNFETTLSVHELGHQWFGDNVICGSWKDIWLNEGFASYTEYLYRSHFYSAADGFNHMAEVHADVMSQPGGTLYVDDTTDDNRIFSTRLTYDKGSSIVHSLRFLINDDSTFFGILRLYQQHFAGKTATTAQFQQLAETALGQNLDTFFNQWIFGEGFPTYSASWNQVGNQLYILLDQTTSKPASIPFFSSPLELRLSSPQGDTIVRINNDQPSQLIVIPVDKTISGIAFDPNDWLLNMDGPVTHNVSLSTPDLAKASVRIYPNPAIESWQADNIPAGSCVELTDVSGRSLWKGNDDLASSIKIPAGTLPAGLYFLRVQNKISNQTFKLLKQ